MTQKIEKANKKNAKNKEQKDSGSSFTCMSCWWSFVCCVVSLSSVYYFSDQFWEISRNINGIKSDTSKTKDGGVQEEQFEFELAEGNTAVWKDGKWIVNQPEVPQNQSIKEIEDQQLATLDGVLQDHL